MKIQQVKRRPFAFTAHSNLYLELVELNLHQKNTSQIDIKNN